jgi:hypothetical protein
MGGTLHWVTWAGSAQIAGRLHESSWAAPGCLLRPPADMAGPLVDLHLPLTTGAEVSVSHQIRRGSARIRCGSYACVQQWVHMCALCDTQVLGSVTP